jgi:hypothetical protein
MRFRGLICDGADERTRCFDGGDADAPRSHANFGSANADAIFPLLFKRDNRPHAPNF